MEVQYIFKYFAFNLFKNFVTFCDLYRRKS